MFRLSPGSPAAGCFACRSWSAFPSGPGLQDAIRLCRPQMIPLPGPTPSPVNSSLLSSMANLSGHPKGTKPYLWMQTESSFMPDLSGRLPPSCKASSLLRDLDRHQENSLSQVLHVLCGERHADNPPTKGQFLRQ